MFLQGDSTVSRKYTVGIATPINAGTPGDIVYFENPDQGSYIGWVYTTANDWRRFGNVSLSDVADIHRFDQVGIATTTPGANAFQIGAGATIFAVSSDGTTVGVGIGTTANTKAIRVHGDTEQVGNVSVTGILTAGFLAGDGNAITNLNASATGWSPVNQTYAGAGNTGIWATVPPMPDPRVGIGTSVPHFNLSLVHLELALPIFMYRTSLYSLVRSHQTILMLVEQSRQRVIDLIVHRVIYEREL